MKNILSENMLRFGVKNLSESNKKKLTLESILQTINEHGLTEDIKRLLNEQQSIDIRGVAPMTGGMSGVAAAFGGRWNYPTENKYAYWSNQIASRVNATGDGGMLELDFVDLGFKASYNANKQGGDKGTGYAVAKPGFIYDANKFANSGIVSVKNNNNAVENGVVKPDHAAYAAKEWNKSAFSQNWQGVLALYGGYDKLKGFAS